MGNKTPGKENRTKAEEEEAEGVNTKWSLKQKQKLLLGIQDVEGRKSGPGWRGPFNLKPQSASLLGCCRRWYEKCVTKLEPREAGRSPCSAATPSRPLPHGYALRDPGVRRYRREILGASLALQTASRHT